MKVFLLLIISFLSSSTFASDGHILYSGEDYDYYFDQNFPALGKERLLNDLRILGSLRGKAGAGTQYHKKIYGDAPVDGRTYLKFINTRVESFGISHCGSPTAIACYYTQGPNALSHKVWLTSYFLKQDAPLVSRLMTVLHEARHTEKAKQHWSHVICPKPLLDDEGEEIRSVITGEPLGGLYACDWSGIGAYGMPMITFMNVKKSCTNCTRKLKMDATVYGKKAYNRLINSQIKREIKRELFDD